jgi:phosphoribosylaminoimidazole-succinocarboxamide synthase
VPLPAGPEERVEAAGADLHPGDQGRGGHHDENIDFERAAEMIGPELAARVRDIAIRLYSEAAAIALTKGIIIADTKFEFGLDRDGTLTLMDEILTPDSSRFWPADRSGEGANPPSYDKQFVRDWLESVRIDGQALAEDRAGAGAAAEVIAQTAQNYRAVAELLR